MPNVKWPHCSAQLNATADYEGRTENCPNCGKPFEIHFATPLATAHHGRSLGENTDTASKALIDPVSLEANRSMLRTFSRTLIPALGVILLCVALLVIILLFGILKSDSPDTRGQTLAVHLVQISLGIVLGLLCLYLGAAMSWFGITGTFIVEAEGGGAQINLRSVFVDAPKIIRRGMSSLFPVGLHIFRDSLSLDLQHLLIAEARELVPRNLLEVEVD
jgi:hypothetical protein